jgi:glycerophosphoryl diester phosphodiesterase
MNPPYPTQIFAHRGANREATENTRVAFDKALNYSIDGMETDVQLSRDDVPVLWHDRYLNKLGYMQQHIDEFDYAELKRINFAYNDTQPETVLSLQEFLNRYRHRCRLQIEIKNRDWELSGRHESKVKQCLELCGDPRDEAVFISTFHLDSIIFAHHYAPDFPLYYALDDYHTESDVEQALNNHDFLAGLCLSIAMLNESIVDLIAKHSKKLITYTCNTNAEISKALELGVNILITDDPQKALLMRG